jgi:hypothetical protein
LKNEKKSILCTKPPFFLLHRTKIFSLNKKARKPVIPKRKMFSFSFSLRAHKKLIKVKFSSNFKKPKEKCKRNSKK